MVILDSNILLYAHIEGFPQHKKMKTWLAQTISNGPESIGIPWQVATSFLRISTNKRIFKQPFDLGLAKQCLDDLFGHPLVHAVTPTNDHRRASRSRRKHRQGLSQIFGLCKDYRSAGGLTKIREVHRFCLYFRQLAQYTSRP